MRATGAVESCAESSTSDRRTTMGVCARKIKTTTCWANTKIYHYISYQIGPNRTGAQTHGGRSRPGLKTS